jgi:hypothetical protein
MAYVRPIIRVREGHRRVVRGGVWDAELGRTVIQATADETFKLNVDLTDILDSATITAAVEADGATVTSAVVAGVVTLTCSAIGSASDVDLTVTFSDGRIQQEFIRLRDPFIGSRDDYGATTANA